MLCGVCRRRAIHYIVVDCFCVRCALVVFAEFVFELWLLSGIINHVATSLEMSALNTT